MKTTLIEIYSNDDLEKLISKSVEKGIEKLKPIKSTDQEEFLTTEEVCKLLKLTRETIWRYTKKGIITSYRIGNLLRYKRSEINQSLIKINHK